ncbi:MAG: M23 family metallopeptidase, partial [Gammaproteobacteria bacterium]
QDRGSKLLAMKQLLMEQQLQKELLPEGRPVIKGWLSSPFGKRIDPLTGRRDFHPGVDFAGHKGSEVLAVASGVVSYAGRRSGYGNIVEIVHGDGLVTRYAHNQKNLVEAGQRVKKGQVIALMGNTGRSTGPHVHFEVLKDGKLLNPRNIVKGLR